MKKRLCKATPDRKQINRASIEYQLLWKEMSKSIKVDRLDEILKVLEPLPYINKKARRVRNKQGVCVESIGTKGKSKYIGVDFCGGVFYFDGNRLGKRKEALVKEVFGFIEEGNISYSVISKKIFKKTNKQCL